FSRVDEYLAGVRLRALWSRASRFFYRIRGPHPDNGIFVPKTSEEFRESFRVRKNEFHDLLDFPIDRRSPPRSMSSKLWRHISRLWRLVVRSFRYARAWPACVFSRRKSGADTSTVRHISYNRERMRDPMRCSSESSRVGGISFPPGSRAASPSEEGLSR